MSINIAIIEDEKKDRDILLQYLERFKKNFFETAGKKIEFKISYFENGVLFLTNYLPAYDIVFMDIQMPHMNGMDVASKLRESDAAVQLVFITNMANFAVSGYSVNAAGFIVKPISYYSFTSIMPKILKAAMQKGDTIVIKTSNGMKKIEIQAITYVEVRDHKTVYHTLNGDVEIWGALKEQEKRLPEDSFMRSSEAHLVNLKYVDEIGRDFVDINGTKIPISRSKKQMFMSRVLEYHGENA